MVIYQFQIIFINHGVTGKYNGSSEDHLKNFKFYEKFSLITFCKKNFVRSIFLLMPSNILFLILLFGISRAYFPLLRVMLRNTTKQYLDSEEILQQDNRLESAYCISLPSNSRMLTFLDCKYR